MKNIKDLAQEALEAHLSEVEALSFLPESRYDRSWWPTLGQYDWFCGQLLYCLIRLTKPERIVEISTSSGYSTVFSALAMKQNGKGRIHTFELDPQVAAGAAKTFQRLGLESWIDLNVGDAKVLAPAKPEIKDAGIYFLDSLHTSEFMLWFMHEVLSKSQREDALFHVHDIMPRHARVRYQNNPGRGLIYDVKRWAYNRWIAGMPAKEVVWAKVQKPSQPGELSYYNGIETMEGVLANELSQRMGDGESLFAYDLAKAHPETNPGRYEAQAVGRGDSFGRPSEWNDAWWSQAGPALKALERWKADGKPLKA